MRKRSWQTIVRGLVTASLLAQLASAGVAQEKTARDYSKETARASRDWVRDGVIYEIFPRAFSPQGNFAGVTAQLDRLKGLGINILWLMPIHPVGRERAKGTIGSPYAVRGALPQLGSRLRPATEERRPSSESLVSIVEPS